MSCQLTTGIEMSTIKYTNMLSLKIEARQTTRSYSVAQATTHDLPGSIIMEMNIGKDADAGRDWGQEEKGTTEDEMAGWHHGLDGNEFE